MVAVEDGPCEATLVLHRDTDGYRPALVAAIKALKKVLGCELDIRILRSEARITRGVIEFPSCGVIEFPSCKHYDEFVEQMHIQLRHEMSLGLDKSRPEEWFEVSLKGG